MFRNEIRLDTGNDIRALMHIITPLSNDIKVSIEDDDGNRVSARSLLGLTYASQEFKHKYCVSNVDISGKIIDFII